MKLEKQNSENPDLDKLYEMITAMRGLLDNPGRSELTLEDMLTFQDDDGSFKLLDSYKIPGDTRIDFCHTPTYMGAAILMRELLSGENDLADALEQALKASLHRALCGHGYESEDGRIDAMNIFIKGGLCTFLETQREFCPEFHYMVHNILHKYNSAIKRGGKAYADYREQWQKISEALPISTRFYIAYGSNMDKEQMLSRCHNAVYVCATYIEDWELTMPFYANIEPIKGKRTPAIVWKINAEDESRLDFCEGYPGSYDKTDIIIAVNGNRISAMAYVMTDKYKNSDKKARAGYEEQIIAAYKAAGFSEKEYMPRRGQSARSRE
jgi:hypothetical protein